MFSIPQYCLLSFVNEKKELDFAVSAREAAKSDRVVSVLKLRRGRDYYDISSSAHEDIAKESVLLPFPKAQLLGKTFIEKNQLQKVKVIVTKDVMEASETKYYQRFPLKRDQTQLSKRAPALTTRQQRKTDKLLNVKTPLTIEDQKKRNLPKFVRNTTTNLRFDLHALHPSNPAPEIKRQLSSHFERADSGLAVSNSYQKKNLLQLITDFCSHCRLVVGDFSALKEPRLKAINLVPQKQETEEAISLLYEVEAILPTSQSMLHLLLKAFLTIVRWLQSLQAKSLFSLKHLLQIEVRAARSLELDAVLLRSLQRLMKLVDNIEDHMDEYHSNQLSVIYSELCVLIVKNDLSMQEWFLFFCRYYDEFAKHSKYQSLLEQVHLEIFKKLQFGDNVEVKNSQPNLYASFMKEKVTSQLGMSSNFWAHLVDAMGKFIKANDRMLDTASVLAICPNIVGKPTSLGKGFALAAIKIIITDQMVKNVMQLSKIEEINSVHAELLNQKELLPFFIYFIQALNQKSGDFRKFEGRGYPWIDKFIERYMFLTPSESLENLQIKLPGFAKYLEERDKLCYLVSKNKDEEFANSILAVANLQQPESLLMMEGPELPAALQPAVIERHKKRFNFFVFLINECYLLYSLDTEPEMLANFKKVFQRIKGLLAKKLERREYMLLEGLFSNFLGFDCMSLSASQSESEIRTRSMMVLATVKMLEISNPKHILHFGAESITTKEQLAALPGPAEEDGRVLASIAYEKLTASETYMMKQAFGDVSSMNRCGCGYTYFIGNCGRPAFERECPSCKIKIGGVGHKFANETNKNIYFQEYILEFEELERLSGKTYQRRDFSNLDPDLSLRFCMNGPIFRFVEFFAHTRYAFELYFQTQKHQALLQSYIGDGPDYLVRVCQQDIEVLQQLHKSLTKACIWMSLVFTQMNIHRESKRPNPRNADGQTIVVKDDPMSRNNQERALALEIYPHYQKAEELIDSCVSEVKTVQSGVLGCKKLVFEWVAKMASISDFANNELETDLRIITGLRLESEVSIDELSKKISNYYPGDDQFMLLKFVIKYDEILQIFRDMFNDHILLNRLLQDKLDCRISWSQACRLTVGDFTPLKDKHRIVHEEDEHLLRAHGNDAELAAVFARVAAWWGKIVLLRDRFPEVFDFRFLCHGNSLPEEKIIEMTDINKARLTYYLVDEQHVESLTMPSILQTFSKFQNDSLASMKKLYQKVNGAIPLTTAVQTAKRSEIIGLSSSLEAFLRQNAINNTKFNKDTDIVFNLPLVEAQLAEDVFFGRCMLSFEEGARQQVTYFMSCGFIFPIVKQLAQRYPQLPLNSSDEAELRGMTEADPSGIFTQFARAVKAVKNNVCITVNGMSVNLQSVSHLYNLIEDRVYPAVVSQVDPSTLTCLDERSSLEVLRLTADEKMRGWLKKLVCRHLSHIHHDQVLNMSVADCLEYTDDVDVDGSDLPRYFVLSNLINLLRD